MSSGTRPSSAPSSAPSPPGETASADLSGRTLGDFRVLRKLGQGGMGQVYLAEQISLKRKVALKVLRPDLAANEQALARFKLEAEAVARATHANIVQVYSSDVADGIPFMALEYVEGRNLKDYVAKKGPPELLVALSIMRQVASALQRAGELGIIHRDVKPENILLTRKGEVKVADFGLARCLEGAGPGVNLTQTGVSMGTPLYMSPEQVEGKPVDSRTDIYSFGVTCYHMLAGQPPFTGATAFEVALAHVRKEPPPLRQLRPDLPEALCAVVAKMMAKEPAQRYQTGRELLRDLARLREGLGGVTGPVAQPTVCVEATPTEPVRQPAFRRPGVLAAAAAGTLVLAAAAGALLAWRERGREGPLGGSDLPPADASVAETIHLPNQREQALRMLVDPILQAAPGKMADPSALSHCLELGLFYLDDGRLADAAALFTRLQEMKAAEALVMLGKVGNGVVLALESKPKESNDLLREVFAPEPGLLGPWKEKKGKVPQGGFPAHRRLEGKLAPIKPLLDHPRGQHWLAKARWYNARNGVPAAQVPRYLIWRFPLESDVRK
jgi:serine/threonine-protein kinase